MRTPEDFPGKRSAEADMRDYSKIFRVFTFVNACFAGFLALFIAGGWDLPGGYLAGAVLSSAFMGFPAAFIAISIAKILLNRKISTQKKVIADKMNEPGETGKKHRPLPFESPYIISISIMMAVASFFVVLYLAIVWNLRSQIGTEKGIALFGPLVFLVETGVMALLIGTTRGIGRKDRTGKKAPVEKVVSRGTKESATE